MIAHINMDDTMLSHSLLNYLNAGCQGRFAGLNMLQQLGLEQDSDKIAKLTSQLKDVAEWYKELWAGGALFAAAWDKPETFEARKAIRYLEELREDLRQLSEDLKSIFESQPRGPLEKDLATLLTASLGRAHYSQDNYLRGLQKLGEFISQKEVVDNATAQLAEHKSDLEFTHAMLKHIKGNGAVEGELAESLLTETAPLGGLFATFVHDINILLARYQGEFDYGLTEIPFNLHEEWKQLGAPARDAGYWYAFGFTPQESIHWRNTGFMDHLIAGTWKAFGYTPEEAAPWNFAKFDPKPALQWIRAGLIPEQALRLIEQGYRTAAEVTAEKKAEVQQEIPRAFNELDEEQP